MTRYDPQEHHRRSIRLRGYDYRLPGAYFVTVVTHDRALLFDDPVLRGVVEMIWQRIPRHFPFVELDQWIVMPNHLHGILLFGGETVGPDRLEGERPIDSGPPPGSLGAIVGNLSR